MASTVSRVPGRRCRALSCICFHGNKENTGFVWSGHKALIQGVAPGESCGRPLWPGPPDSRGVMGSSQAGWGPQTWLVTGSMAEAAGSVLIKIAFNAINQVLLVSAISFWLLYYPQNQRKSKSWNIFYFNIPYSTVMAHAPLQLPFGGGWTKLTGGRPRQLISGRISINNQTSGLETFSNFLSVKYTR